MLHQHNNIITVSLLGGCDGLQKLISNNYHFGRVWCLERTDFAQFFLWEGVLLIKGEMVDNFHF